ncbi:glycerol-3-phosphate responsive antiterminator [Paenibacillus sp. Marseille-Q4541]|uniref:glycerol-3-phosphate responsive antiterminator n=1 Tax=Paenibacillus sp. Marseille-Q4541 TaxID=2831522 RepID=UPI001BA7C748|nr:glycerol-3-phosphate responsive antiterminator [Paenibacillus sp. Marseille-Q4541]
MTFLTQPLLPAVKSMKQLEFLLSRPVEYIILLDSHVAQIKNIVELARQHGKQVFLHADLIQGLKNDEYAAEFLCQEIRPEGLISTRADVIRVAKQKGLVAIQRIFLLDTIALDKSYALLQKTKPDYIEVLPGIMPRIISEVSEKTGIKLIAGGLIRTVEDVENATNAGAVAVTTSNEELIRHYI